ncbi:MAG: serine/threonine-protein kinase [Pseudomonadota bacterium]
MLRLLGVGGMAEVFLARTTGAQGFEKVVVVKRMLSKLARDPRFVKMFIDEAKLAVQLSHANIVQILTLAEHAGTPFIVMEYVHGRDLFSALRTAAQGKAGIPVDFGLHCIVEMLKGLSYAHTASGSDGRPLHLVHRDVTPSNIFISFDGEVKLGDFGVAHATGEVDRREVRGKFGYLAPEALHGQQLDARADLFSAGVVLWETLAGRRLFSGKNDTDVLRQVRDRVPEPPSLFNPKVPPDLDAISAKALAKDPDQRYSSAAEFEESLSDYLFARRLRWTRRRISDVLKALFPDDSKPLVLPPPMSRDARVADASDDFEDDTDRLVIAVTDTELTPSKPPGSMVESRVQWPESLDSAIVEVPDVNQIVLSQAMQRAQAEQVLVHWADGNTVGMRIPEIVRTLTYEPHTVAGLGVIGEWKMEVPELAGHLLWDSLAGIQEPASAPEASGSLARVSLVRLLYELTLRRMSGLVAITSDDGRQRRHLYLEGGYPVYVASDDPRDGAPARLIEHNMLSISTLYRALVQVLGDRMSLDQALVSVAGTEGQAHVERMFSALVRSRLYAAFSWYAGSFQIYPGIKPETRLSFRTPPLLGILTRAVHRGMPLDELQTRLHTLGQRAVMLNPKRKQHITALHLRPDEVAVVQAIDGTRTLPAILELVGANTSEAHHAVLVLLYVLAETQIASLM